jgi:phage-related protein
LIVGGTVKAPNDTAFWQAYGKLSLISNNLFTTRDMTVVEVPTTKRVSFVRGGKVRKEIKPGRVDFEIPLLAPDPRKYNDTEDTAALAGTITNEGDFETHPTLTLTAGGDYTITNTTQGAGASLVIVGAPVGAVVDMKLRTVLLGAVDYYSTVQPQSIWWTLLPGANIITKSGGAASITWRDAWI